MSEALRPIPHPLPEDRRVQLVELLNERLAATADLQMQAKQAHWNVTGIHFYSLHELFDAVAEGVEPFVDVLAERITALGGVAKGTVRMAAAASSLPEYPLEAEGGEEHLTAVRDRLATYATDTLRAIDAAGELGDSATEDLFVEIQREIDKLQYFVASHLV
ncbi:MAG: DNA starvation/stationary phase protection protein Dps [Trueperaceae bacterium]